MKKNPIAAAAAKAVQPAPKAPPYVCIPGPLFDQLLRYGDLAPHGEMKQLSAALEQHGRVLPADRVQAVMDAIAAESPKG